MKIDWKSRLKNKAILAAIISAAVAFVYQILGFFDIVPPISESDITNVVGIVLNALVFLGIIVDPTTDGISDSESKKGD